MRKIQLTVKSNLCAALKELIRQTITLIRVSFYIYILFLLIHTYTKEKNLWLFDASHKKKSKVVLPSSGTRHIVFILLFIAIFFHYYFMLELVMFFSHILRFEANFKMNFEMFFSKWFNKLLSVNLCFLMKPHWCFTQKIVKTCKYDH